MHIDSAEGELLNLRCGSNADSLALVNTDNAVAFGITMQPSQQPVQSERIRLLMCLPQETYRRFFFLVFARADSPRLRAGMNVLVCEARVGAGAYYRGLHLSGRLPPKSDISGPGAAGSIYEYTP